MIAVVDYGMGNLSSVRKACEFLGARVRVTSDPKQVAKAGAVILPGVGAFGEAMAELRRRQLLEPVKDAIRSGKPFLGLCLGLQLLFDSSEESPGVKGLGILPGRVRRFPRFKSLKVPHMGWNQIHRFPSSPRKRGSDSRSSIAGEEKFRENALLRDIPDGAFAYFVHSYYAEPDLQDCVAAKTHYGRWFPSIVWNSANVWATQFHPEKSQKWGLKILKNFLTVVPGA